MFKNSIKIGPTLLSLILILLVLSLFSVNPLPTFCAIVFVPIAAKLLWKKGEVPILFVGILLQWVQICIKILYASVIFVPFENLFSNPYQIKPAFYFSLTALLVISLGINLATRKSKIISFGLLESKSNEYDKKKIMFTYLCSIILYPLLLGVAGRFGGLQQLIIKLLDLKWSIFVLFFLVTFKDASQMKQKFLLIVSAEIVLSFTGYFSAFKEFFIIGFILYLFINEKLTKKEYSFMLFAGVILFNMLVVWQFIKPDYRSYLSGGEQAQIVSVSRNDALTKAFELGNAINQDKYQDAVTALIDRISYIDIFSASISYVPISRPHTHGRLWLDAIKRVLMPRLFFPGKTAINDSEKTMMYTGLGFAGNEQGTSISMGYVAETYVDFGFPMMLLPLFLFGLLIGFMFKYIINHSYNDIWGICLVIPLFFQISTFEFALDKIVGSLITFFIIYLLINKFLAKRIDQYIRQ
ncbi:hypothetical protein [Pedobacter rhizosphaerae]|uniref:O-antigen polysaccharide polymerase Wzy n=1 Tax=Pedobacter rhizosphaerae TaxID=390241 RepID=A0A1H9N5L3_9SPHI|nr:hypothetical protein [Pedobacter rhizosphaerae]SER31340.1 hypothetical protein SAMN04488023_10762 [Pedobacter rhizosphaerae]